MIVTFHIGRGGRFNNQGHKSFDGISDEQGLNNYLRNGSYFLNYSTEKREEAIEWVKEEIEKKYNALLILCDDFEKQLRLAIDEDGYNNIINSIGLDEEDFQKQLGNKVWCDGNGTEIISEEEADNGIGEIDNDGDYDTHIWKEIQDCDECEINIIMSATGWEADEAQQELIKLGLVEEEE